VSSPEGGLGDQGYTLPKEAGVQLQIEVARKYRTEESALRLLERIGFPRERIPIFRSPQVFWREVFSDLDRGVIADPYRALHEAIAESRNRDRAILSILEKARDKGGPSESQHAGTTHRRRNTCDAILWTENDIVRQRARAILYEAGLDPQQVWANTEMTSFNVSEANESQAREVIVARRPTLLYKIVPPDQADYLVDLITVAGRTGEFPMRRVPVQLTVRDLAESAARLHPSARSTTAGTVGSAVVQGGGRTTPPIEPSSTLLSIPVRNRDKVMIEAVSFGKIRVLVIGANPRRPSSLHGRCDLRYDEEARQIEEIAQRGHIELVRVLSRVQKKDLPKIVDDLPDIIHVCAHGDAGNIILEDADGDPSPMGAVRFSEQLARWQQNTDFLLDGIVLSSCSGETIAPVFVSNGATRTVVAHQRALEDPRAQLFTRSLYDRLYRTPILSSAAYLAAEDVYDQDGGPDGRVLIIPPPPKGDW
jgi:hypothetical protein